MTTRTRYFLLQIPGWVLANALLAALHRWLAFPAWAAVVIWAVYVAKDFILYPHLRSAYETKSPSGAERMIGQVGLVKRPLEPQGTIQLAGDLWQARADGQAISIPAGRLVRVERAEGLVLIVSPESQPTSNG